MYFGDPKNGNTGNTGIYILDSSDSSLTGLSDDTFRWSGATFLFVNFLSVFLSFL